MSNPVNVPAVPVYSPPHATPSNQTSSGAVTAQVSAVPCRLLRLTVTNGNAAPRYLQIFDKATAPATGERPRTSTMLAAGAMYTCTTQELGPAGMSCSSGCVVATSTKPDSFAAGSADLTVTEAWIG